MSQDTTYSSVPYIYKSRGLSARAQTDQAPEYTYLDLLNCLEREESAMSSRYGTQIVNRDPAGTGTANHFFAHPVTTLSRMTYQGSAWRYAGTSDGTLYRRSGNLQGAYSSIYTGLSGGLFGSLVTNCFETSQPYLFIYDAAQSIKDSGTGTPELTGIDPPTYTANAQPYAPLLTMIDSFAAPNGYSTTGISGWAYAGIVTLTAASVQPVTDFSQFFGIQQSGGSVYTPTTGVPEHVSVTQVGSGSSGATSGTISGFSSLVIVSGESINVIATVDASLTVGSSSGGAGGGGINFQYSADSGATWTTFYGWGGSSSATLPSQQVSFPISGIGNINQLQLRLTASAGTGGPTPPTITVSGDITAVSATVTSSGVFGIVAPGMISVQNTNTSINIPIVNVISSDLVAGLYTTLTVTTQTAHGLSSGSQMGIYGSSNDLVDGYYTATVLTSTTFTVPFISAVQIGVGAIGGTLVGGAILPFACVLTNQYSTPYPTQLTAFGFYQQAYAGVFPIGAWSGTVAQNSVGTVTVATQIDLNQNNQITDDDLIVLTLAVSDPSAIDEIRLQFNCGTNTAPVNYYYKSISPTYYQQGVDQLQNSYTTTEQQILADSLGLLTGALPNSTTAQLQTATLSTGQGAWVAVYMRRGDFLPVGQAGQSGLDWASIAGWTLTVTTNTVGSASFSCNGLYLQWGYGPSSYGGLGYDYRYTYYDANTGTESNGSEVQQFSLQFGYLPSQVAPIVLRQAFQVTGQYSTDLQVTHVRFYRRGGGYNDNWFQLNQIPNLTSGGQFVFKDVAPDLLLAQSDALVLDNDPPVTSSLKVPIVTSLSAATTQPGGSNYSLFQPQIITAQAGSTVFVTGQIVDVGYSQNLEQVRVIAGGVGQFTAIVRLQHNIGDPVNVYSIPRQPCNLCALAYDQVWLAGDPNNPHYLYYSKKGLPESFGPQNYVKVSSPDDPINAVINWRGTLIVGTLKTWYIIVGGAQPYPQPTGSEHGIVAQGGWTTVESAVWNRAADGLREFTGADAAYKTLEVEWIYRLNPECIPPQADPAQASQDVMAYYNNCVYTSYISLNSGVRYRLIYDRIYQRFRYDDVPATAMLWEKDIDTFLVAKKISTGNYAIVQDQVGDYDDGGWVAGALVQTPINLTIQTPYRDLGKPAFPKQWNMFETDTNTQNQNLQSTLLFDDGTVSIALPAANTGTTRQKVQFTVNGGDGQQAYRASIKHQMAVTVAPTLYQEDIYAAVLADYNTSIDTYWIKFGTDLDKFVKQGYFDYTAAADILVTLFADNSATPYWTFTLPAQAVRAVVRERFSSVNPGASAFTLRTWRMIANSAGDFQMWNAPSIDWKPIGGNSYKKTELVV